MMNLTCKPTSEYGVAEIATYVTQGFAGYFVPIVMTEANLLARVRLDSVDLTESRVVLADHKVAGVALMARRGWASRLAAMGILPEWRGKGAGKFLMNELLQDARKRGDHEMVLEVIIQNEAAVNLYQSSGFQKVRRLVGLTGGEPGARAEGLEEIDIRQVARLITRHGLPDLPWQLTAETIAQFAAPFRAYHLHGAYAIISDPTASDVRFLSLLVEPSRRHEGRARQLIGAILASYPSRNWHVPAIFPEELVGPFEGAGFKRETLAQWQMRLDIR